MYYVYILKSERKNKVYIGFSSDLKKRLLAHKNGQSRTTRNWLPIELVYYEAYRDKKDAIIREKRLKQFKNGYNELKKRIANSLLAGANKQK